MKESNNTEAYKLVQRKTSSASHLPAGSPLGAESLYFVGEIPAPPLGRLEGLQEVG